MKKTIKVAVMIMAMMMLLTIGGCSEANRVSSNLALEADNFNIVRQVTVINCIQGDVLFQLTGKISITKDNADNQLEIVIEDEGAYKKGIFGLADNVTYTVIDLENVGVSKYKYTLNYNPNMWIPIEFKNID